MQILHECIYRARKTGTRSVKVAPTLPAKIERVVKFTFILLLTTCLQAAAKVYSQSVTLSAKKMALEQVFTEVRKQTGYVFFYDELLLKDCKPVSFDVSRKPLQQFLDLVLQEQPLSYRFENKTIVIRSRERSSDRQEHADMVAAHITIKGRITTKQGEPVMASIMIKGTSQGISSGPDGYFTMYNVDENAVLVISAMNIIPIEVKVNSQRQLNIIVTKRAADIREVIINAGYYNVKAAEATGSIATIDSKTIEKQPVTNVLQALEGRLPGVMITQQSGAPGSGISVQIRAANSMYAGTLPLYIVDGVPYPGEALYSAGGNTVGNLKPSFGSSPLNMLNPNDIESISVLKDADATSIYGSRGANGVVLINTKKAQSGKARLDVSLSSGISAVGNLQGVKTLSPEQYREIRHRAFANSVYGTVPNASNAPDLLVWDTTKTTDFQKLLFGNTARVHDANLSFSAGTNTLSTLISGTYHKENNVIPGDFNYERGGLRINTNYNSPDSRMGINVGITYNVDRNQSVARVGSRADLAAVAYSFPYDFPLYKDDGSLYWAKSNSSIYNNPLAYMNRRYEALGNTLLGNFSVRLNPLKELTVKINGSYNRSNMEQRDLAYQKSFNPFVLTAKPAASYQENYSQTWNLEPTIEYMRAFGGLKANLLAGATFQDSKFVQPYYISASNFSSDAMLRNFTAAGNYTINSYDSEYKYSSGFARLNLNWHQKYILNANYRLDASSRFGKNNRTGSFGSVGGAWLLSEESFFKPLRFVSFAKIRGSFGYAGNDQIGNYQFSDNYSTSPYQYDGVATMVPANLSNPNLKWEVNQKTELALEMGFLDRRISFTGAWFSNQTNNPLARFPLSTVTGFENYIANLDATIRMTGTEFSLSTRNIEHANFTWSTAFHISFAQSKLTAFDDIKNSNYTNDKIVGESLANIYGYQYAGIEKRTGLPAVADADGNGTVFDYQKGLAYYGKGDMVKIGNYNPDFFGGFTNSFSYRNFQLDIFVQYVGRTMIKGIAHYDYSPNSPGYLPANMTASAYDLFKATDGKLATVDYDMSDDAPLNRYYLYANSSATISNAAFIRLKNVALSYNLPAKWLRKIGVKNATLYTNAQNLFTMTDFEGYDPETQPNNIPPLRTFVFGLRATL
jgi:TonB-dependent starch-binding outer membrane protein SusC